MQNVVDDFNERVKEIEEYLHILQMLAEPNVRIKTDTGKQEAVSLVALKTMKASCFLMLYNLVESTIINSMTNLYETMNSEGRCLLDFDSCVKEVWIEQQFRNMDPFSSNQTSYRNLIKTMVDAVLNSQPIFLRPDKLHISGNLDAREIRRIFEKHKIPTQTHYRAFGGGELRTIKDQRNSLAHGAVSFASCGQGFTVSSIIDIKKQTVVYLRSALRNIRRHIKSTHYAA
jgi:hypothetical protein